MTQNVLLQTLTRGDIDIIKALLAKSAEVNARNKDGGSALLSAAGYHNENEILSLLLVNGADPRSTDNNRINVGTCSRLA